MPEALPDLFASRDTRQSLDRAAEAFVTRALTMLGRAEGVVKADRSASLGLLTGRRDALFRHFQRYQRFKHHSIFDPVIRHGTTSSQIVARTMKSDCVAMGQVFAAYHSRWCRSQADEWAAYRRDMLETVGVVSRHLHEERRAISQLLMISDFYGKAR